MKKSGFLSAPVAEIIATMGHTDRIVVCDSGFPVPMGVQRIDLAVTDNLPPFPDVLRVLLGDLAVERFILASETKDASPARYAQILEMLDGVPHEEVPHVDFKVLAREARAVIRTGDIVPYSNIILVSGVTYS
jgi:D-ribose pyranase